MNRENRQSVATALRSIACALEGELLDGDEIDLIGQLCRRFTARHPWATVVEGRCACEDDRITREEQGL
jgi:hypothetical protein